jgi:cell division protein FtsB
MRTGVPKWAWGWVAAVVATLLAVWTFNGGKTALSGAQDEILATVEALNQARAEKAVYEADNAKLRQLTDSLRKVRAKRDTLYVAKRDSALVLADSIPLTTQDSAALLPAVQNACREALNACDLAKAAAAAEIATLTTRTEQDSTRIKDLTQSVDSLNTRVLEILTAPEPPPTFGERVKKVAVTVGVILAIIGSFFLGQAAP